MTYQAYEESTFNGSPLELFKFVSDVNVYGYTNNETPVSHLGTEYAPLPVTRGKIEQNAAESPGLMAVRLPRDCAVAALFGPFLPAKPVGLTVFRRHLNDPDAQFVPIFVGTVATCSFEGDEAVLSSYNLIASLKRRVPWLTYQPNCNWALYHEGCGVDRNAFRLDGVVASVSGLTLNAAVFGTQPDGWLRAGWVQRVNTREVRFITSHVGDDITLQSPFPGRVAGEPLVAFAGCMRDEATCSAKFNNLPRMAGWPDVPSKNPYRDNVYGSAGKRSAGSSTTGITGVGFRG